MSMNTIRNKFISHPSGIFIALLFIAAICFGAAFSTALAGGRKSATERANSAHSADALDQNMQSAFAAIAGKAMMNIHAYTELEDLSDDIGPRVTGSPQCNQAIEWGVATMKQLGLKNVHAEPWQISRGWTRVSASARVISPAPHPLMIDSMGWAGSTPAGGVDADVVAVNVYQLDQELAQNSGNWRGKVLLAVQRGERPQNGMGLFAKFGTFLQKAHEAGAVAVIGGQGGAKSQGMHITHTGALGFNTYYDIPVVSISAEGQDLLERFLDRGKPLRIHIDIQNKITSGPANTANVVGDIPGAEHPEQIVVVGGHLDSWDLATGATDDGAGVATTLGAAEAILRSGFKPHRTIRFVLFTGEEEGLLGSLAYVQRHKSDMQNHIAAVILDEGQGPVDALNMGGHDDLLPAANDFVSELASFGKISVNDRPVFGTDAGPFILAGLPGINLSQDSPDYRYTHHSNVDTFDKIDEAVLNRDAAVQALVAFWIADRPERLGSPWPPEKTAQMLIDKHQDTMLKQFGIWPFGDLGGQK